jgi:hypothetical protein
MQSLRSSSSSWSRVALLITAVSAVAMGHASSASAAVYSTPFTPGAPSGPGSLITSWSATIDTSSPTYRRAGQSANASETAPNAPTSLFSTTVTNVYRYHTQTFTPATTGSYEFYSAQSFDGHLHLYSPTFDPANALTNVLAGDDDMTVLNGGVVPNRGGVTGTSDSGLRFALTAGVTYNVVTSSYFNTTSTSPSTGTIYNEVRNASTAATPRSPILGISDGTPTGPGTPLIIPLTITDPGFVDSLNSVTIRGAEHSWVGDLSIQLRHVASGTTIDIIDRLGATTPTSAGSSSDLSANNTYTITPTGAAWSTATIIPGGTYAQFTNPAGGSTATNGAFASFNGLSLAGSWELIVIDYVEDDFGAISAFSLDITGVIPEPASFTVLAGSALLALRRRR